MMNPRYETSLRRMSIAIQILSVVIFAANLSLGMRAALIDGASLSVIGLYVYAGIGWPVALWFIALCGKVLADLHGYCSWAQENAM